MHNPSLSPILSPTKGIDFYRNQICSLNQDLDVERKQRRRLTEELTLAQEKHKRAESKVTKWRGIFESCAADLDSPKTEESGGSPDTRCDADNGDNSDAEAWASMQRMRTTVLDVAQDALQLATAQVRKLELIEKNASTNAQQLHRQVERSGGLILEHHERLAQANGYVDLLEAIRAAKTRYQEVGRQLRLAADISL